MIVILDHLTTNRYQRLETTMDIHTYPARSASMKH